MYFAPKNNNLKYVQIKTLQESLCMIYPPTVHTDSESNVSISVQMTFHLALLFCLSLHRTSS
jgi:hypothetical protein